MNQPSPPWRTKQKTSFYICSKTGASKKIYILLLPSRNLFMFLPKDRNLLKFLYSLQSEILTHILSSPQNFLYFFVKCNFSNEKDCYASLKEPIKWHIEKTFYIFPWILKKKKKIIRKFKKILYTLQKESSFYIYFCLKAGIFKKYIYFLKIKVFSKREILKI